MNCAADVLSYDGKGLALMIRWRGYRLIVCLPLNFQGGGLYVAAACPSGGSVQSETSQQLLARSLYICSLNFTALLRLSLNGHRDLPDSPVARIKFLAEIDLSRVFFFQWLFPPLPARGSTFHLVHKQTLNLNWKSALKLTLTLPRGWTSEGCSVEDVRASSTKPFLTQPFSTYTIVMSKLDVVTVTVPPRWQTEPEVVVLSWKIVGCHLDIVADNLPYSSPLPGLNKDNMAK